LPCCECWRGMTSTDAGTQPQMLELPVHRMLTGERVALLRMRDSDSVAALANEVERAVDVDAAVRATLWCGGAALPDEASLRAAGLQHGSRIEVVLQRRAQKFEFNADAVRVLKGSAILTVLVGGLSRMRTQGQRPPKCGDAWELDFDAAPGDYELVFRGGRNPHHGVLTVRIDGQVVGTVDQYSRDDEFPTENIIRWQGCAERGRHTLQGAVESCHPDAVGRKYWLCLTEIEIRPCES